MDSPKTTSLRGLFVAFALSCGMLLPLLAITLSYWGQPFWFTLLVLLASWGAGAYFFYLISTRLSASAAYFAAIQAQLLHGELPTQVVAPVAEYSQQAHFINALVEELRKILQFALHVSKGEYDHEIKVFSEEGELGSTLSKVRLELKGIAQADHQRNWASEGMAQLNEILRKETEFIALSDRVLALLVKYTRAAQGTLFTCEVDKDNSPFLEMKAAYAFNRKKYLEGRIRPGEGLAGQVLLEGQTLYLKEIPQNYLKITSGLGEGNPRNILVVPLKTDYGTEGILELASFYLFEPHQVAFVEKAAEAIALTLSGLKTNQTTRNLLEETQTMTEQLRAQEEEMRQNMEELEATQEEMQRNQQQTLQKEANLRALVDNAGAAIVSVDRQYRVLIINEEMINFYKQSGTEVKIGDVLFSSQLSEALQHRKAYYDRALNGEQVFVTEEISGRSNGQGVYYEISYNPIQLTGKGIVGVSVFARNVSTQLHARQEIEKQQALLKALINNTDDSILVLDRNYNVMIINDRYKERYARMGYDYQVGMNAFAVMDKSIHEEWKGYYDRALSGEKFTFQRILEVEGKTSTREYIFSPIFSGEEVIGLSIFNRLLSEVMA